MRILLAPNAFKESLSAPQAARAMAAGFRAALPAAELLELPVADGGDGTAEALAAATGGRLLRKRVTGPLGATVAARYALLGDGRTAVIEIAEAAGLRLVPPKQRNPLKTTTYGAGELVLAAARRGARRIVLGLGGSATVDCGCGLAQALGVRLLDRRGRELPPGGGALETLDRIDSSTLNPALEGVRILVACDVRNPLTGPRGGIRIYSPQKGASPPVVERLEAGARHFARIAKRDLGVAVSGIPGAGAAGGFGAGLIAFLGAELRPGIELVLDAVRFEERARGADLIVTGEGRIDRQTQYGKAPAGVAAAAQKLGIPCVALCGSVGPGAGVLHRRGLTAMHSIVDEPLPLEEALRRAPTLLKRAAERLARTWAAGANSRNLIK